MSAALVIPASTDNTSRIEQLSNEILKLISIEKQQLDIKDKKLYEKKVVYEKELNNVLDEERNKLQEFENQYFEAKSQWEYNQNKFAQTVYTTKIKLDVGGKNFATSKATLSSAPNSFFSSIIDGRLSAEEDGSYFIDRDPTVFHLILNFLRGYPIQRELLSTSEYELLVSDAGYFQLSSLIEHLNSPASVNQIGTLSPVPVFKPPIQSGTFRWAAGPNYTVTPDGTTIISQANGSWNATAISNAPFPNSGIVEFCVQIKSTLNSHIMIGVAPPSIDQNLSGNFSQGVGYYLYCARGTLYSKEGVKLDSPYSNTTSSIGIGDVVKIVINFDLFTISFAVNGVDYGFAYSFPRNTDLLPAVIFYDPTDSVTKV